MTYEAYAKIMGYLDEMEAALDRIAANVGHPPFKEWKEVQNDRERTPN